MCADLWVYCIAGPQSLETTSASFPNFCGLTRPCPTKIHSARVLKFASLANYEPLPT